MQIINLAQPIDGRHPLYSWQKCGYDIKLDAKLPEAPSELMHAVQQNDVARLKVAVQGLARAHNSVSDVANITSSVSRIDGMSPLHIAIERGNEVLVPCLIELGANINQLNAAGWTPLHFAAYHGRIASIDMLVKAGARLDIPIDNGRFKGKTIIELAAANGHVGVVERLLFSDERVKVQSTQYNH